MEKYLFIGYTSHNNRLYGVRILKLPDMTQLSISLSEINNYHILGSRGDHWNLLQSKSKTDLVSNNIPDLWRLWLSIPVWDKAGNLISKGSNSLSIEAQNTYGKSVNYIYDLSNSIIDMSFDGFSLLYGDYRYIRYDGYNIITPDIIDESDLLCTDIMHYKGTCKLGKVYVIYNKINSVILPEDCETLIIKCSGIGEVVLPIGLKRIIISMDITKRIGLIDKVFLSSKLKSLIICDITEVRDEIHWREYIDEKVYYCIYDILDGIKTIANSVDLY
jgi:hypothetical protein